MDPGEIKRQIGSRLKRLRSAAGMSQAAFARRVGLTQRAVSGLERGLYMPSVETLMKITATFGMSAASILEPRSNPTTTKDAAIDALCTYLRSRRAEDIRRVHRVARAMLEGEGTPRV